MRKILKLEPDGFPCSFAECPPGPFLQGETVCFKTEYSDEHDGKYFGRAYVGESGEVYWGGTGDPKARDAITVQPLKVKWDVEDVG